MFDDLPIGTKIFTQFALQYDGKETEEDLLLEDLTPDQPGTEWQMPYKASFSLDVGGDCIDFCRNLIIMITGEMVDGEYEYRNIGNWSEGVYQNYKREFIPWGERRAGDVILYKLSDRNPNATHGSLCIGGGKILQTSSRSNPLRVDDDSWNRDKVVGVCRTLTDEEYEFWTIQEQGAIMEIRVNGEKIGEFTQDDVVTIQGKDDEPVVRKAVCIKGGSGYVNVRDGRGGDYKQYEVIGQVYEGEQVEVIDDTLDHEYLAIVWDGGVGYAWCDNGNHFAWL